MTSPISEEVRAQYTTLFHGCGLVDFHDRTQLEVTGQDRVTFVNNLCTNDIRHLEPGQGCEAFLTTVQGRTLAHVFVFCAPDSLIVETAEGQGALLMSHFDRYLITEDVQLTDRTAEWVEWLLAGAEAREVLQRAGAECDLCDPCSHANATLGSASIWLRSVPWLPSPAYQLVTAVGQSADVANELRRAGAKSVEMDVFHMLRLEEGFPWFPSDITEKNLPQEVGRDALTISFTKGCYLGQETVARLDALGHVNRRLCGVRCEGMRVPEVGESLTVDEKQVGQVSSAAFSPRLNAPLALAYLHIPHDTLGSPLTWSGGKAEVIALPLTSTV